SRRSRCQQGKTQAPSRLGSLSFLARRKYSVRLGLEAETPARLCRRSFRLNSVREFISNDAPQCLKAVFPGNLLSFLVGPARVCNWYLVDAPLLLADFCRDLRFESKSVRFDLYSCKHLSPEHLVTRLHVRQFQVRKNVRKQRQHPVRHVVPKIMHALRPA